MARAYRDFDHHEVGLPFLYVRQGELHQVYQDERSLWQACRDNFFTTKPETIVAVLQAHDCLVRWIRTDGDALPLRPFLAITDAEFLEAKERLWAAMDKDFPGVEHVDWAHTKSFIYVDRTRSRRGLWCRGDDIDVELPTSDPRYFEVYDQVTALFNELGRQLAVALDADFFL